MKNMKTDEYVKYRTKKVSHRNVAETAIRLGKSNKNKTWDQISKLFPKNIEKY